MAAPAAVLQILVTANSAQAVTGLRAVDAQAKKTAASTTASTSRISSGFAQMASVAKTALVAGVAYGLYSGVRAGIEFEKQMDAVGAVTDASAKKMKKLENQALRLGQKTAFSATEAAKAQEELAKGGLATSDILGGALKSSLNLAAAGQLDLTVAAETTVNAMKLFELQGKDAGEVADMFATAANRTTADVEDFAMALKQGGSAAKAAGYDLNQTMVVLEALAEAGIKNSDAGTSMKTAFLQLLAPTEKQVALAKQLNIDWVNQNGNLKSAVGISKELQDALGGMTNAQQAENLKVLAGTDGFRTLNALMDEGPAKLRELAKANREQGTAQEVAKKKMDNTAGSIEQLQGAWETLSISLFKKAESPFRSVIDSMTRGLKRFTAIVTDKTLTSDEKISKVIQLITGAIEDAIPKIAGLGVKIGTAILKGMANAFIHGDILTKLFVAGTFIRMIGGVSVLTSLGTAIGNPIGAAAAVAIAAMIAYELEKEHHFAGKALFKGTTFFDSDAGEAFLADIENKNKQTLYRIVRAWEANGNKLTEQQVYTWQRQKKITALGAVDLLNVIERLNRNTGEAFRKLREAAGKAGDGLRGFANNAGNWLRKLAQGGREDILALGQALKGPLEKALDRSGESVRDFTRKAIDAMDDLQDKGGNSLDKFSDKSKRMADKVGNNLTNLARVVTSGLGIIVSNTNKALEGFGVKKVAISLTKVGNAAKGFQTGGVIVPGQGDGDKVPAMLEPGEVVLNKRAVAAMGGADRANSINRKIPRFAKGGIAGANPTVSNFVQGLIKRFGGSVSSGMRSTDSGSLHSTGQAIDYVPNNWPAAAAAVNQAGSSLLEGIYNPGNFGGPAVSWDNGQRVSPSFWGGSTWAGHLDHIHIAIADGARVAAGAVAEKIKRILLKGPDGPLKDLGQASLDKVRDAANKYIASKMPTQGPEVSTDVGGSVVAQMGKILLTNNFSRAGAAGIIGNAYRESLWNPGAVGTGGGGLFGFTTSPVSLADLQRYADKKGQPWTDVPTQMAFMLGSPGGGGLMTDSYYNGLESFLKSTNDIHDATYRFMNEWERPGIPAFEDRLAGAHKAFRMNSWQQGGIVQKLAKGGKPDKGKGDLTIPTSPWVERGRDMWDRIMELGGEDAQGGKVAYMLERIQIAEDLADADGFLSGEELERQIALHSKLLRTYKKLDRMAKRGSEFMGEKLGKTKDKKLRRQLKGLRRKFEGVSTATSGLTGKGGLILAERLLLNSLRGTSTTDDTAKSEDLAALLLQTQQRLLVSQRQYGMFAATPIQGAFAKGGMASRTGAYLVGERGPEVVNLAAGDRVTPGTGPVNVSVTLYEGSKTALIDVNGKEFEAAVKRVNRRQARSGGRVLPGRAGS